MFLSDNCSKILVYYARTNYDRTLDVGSPFLFFSYQSDSFFIRGYEGMDSNVVTAMFLYVED